VADEGFDPIHPESIIGENMPKVKLLGKVPEGELKEQASESETKEVERPPLSEVLSLYDMEKVAQAVMKPSSWGYYFTGERDEYTKTGNVLVRYFCSQCFVVGRHCAVEYLFYVCLVGKV
jgi:hypothetical protein